MLNILSGAFNSIDGLKAAIVTDQWSDFFVGLVLMATINQTNGSDCCAAPHISNRFKGSNVTLQFSSVSVGMI